MEVYPIAYSRYLNAYLTSQGQFKTWTEAWDSLK